MRQSQSEEQQEAQSVMQSPPIAQEAGGSGTECVAGPLPPSLLRLVHAQRRRTRFLRLLTLPGGFGGFLVMMPFIAASIAIDSWPNLFPFIPEEYRKPVSAVFFALGIPAYATLIPLGWATVKSWLRGVREMVAQNDTRLFGPLLEILGFEYVDKKIPQIDMARMEARRGLLKLLPRLTAQDVALLTTAQRQLLHRLVTRQNVDAALENVPLSIGILEVLGRCGDSSDLPVLRLVATNQGRHYHPDIQKAATEALASLEARLR